VEERCIGAFQIGVDQLDRLSERIDQSQKRLTKLELSLGVESLRNYSQWVFFSLFVFFLCSFVTVFVLCRMTPVPIGVIWPNSNVQDVSPFSLPARLHDPVKEPDPIIRPAMFTGFAVCVCVTVSLTLCVRSLH